MHHLHPRSRSTSTLFTTTLAVSFIVVAIPHLLPCPADRRQFADSSRNAEGKIRRRRVKDEGAEAEDTAQNAPMSASMTSTTELLNKPSSVEDLRPKRECPVPKPTGIVGQILGFANVQKQEPAEVVVQEFKANGSRKNQGQADDGS